MPYNQSMGLAICKCAALRGMEIVVPVHGTVKRTVPDFRESGKEACISSRGKYSRKEAGTYHLDDIAGTRGPNRLHRQHCFLSALPARQEKEVSRLSQPDGSLFGLGETTPSY